ncbi:hypothetical protein PSTT_10263, partial [Puccinia striiformis]
KRGRKNQPVVSPKPPPESDQQGLHPKYLRSRHQPRKKTTPKKQKIRKEEFEDKDDDQEAISEENEPESRDEKKKKKKNHNWTEEQRIALLSLILDQVDLGKGTDNRNLKSEGWTAVQKRYHQLKNQKGDIRKLFRDMKFLLALSGFGWNNTTQMVTADGDTWDELIKFHRTTWLRSSLSMELMQLARRPCNLARLHPRKNPDEHNNTSSELSKWSRNLPVNHQRNVSGRTNLMVVSITDYIGFIRVVETEANAEVFISLASTTDPTTCKAWLLASASPSI